MNTFCTIITADYYPRALALFSSLLQFDTNARLQVLVADTNEALPLPAPPGVQIYYPQDLSGYYLVDELYKKYAHIHIDNFRWSMKPVFAAWLLTKEFDKVFYIDCDMFFVNDYRFLFTEFDTADFILTANWKTRDPLIDKESFLSQFTSGMYSAGFFGVTKNGIPALHWWANACHFMMEPSIHLGVHDDQRYLDLLPVIFDTTKIIRHRGCNIGAWNMEESVRSITDGQVMINGEYPVVFIHFDNMMVASILKGHDPLLRPWLDAYESWYRNNGYTLEKFLPDLVTYSKPSLLRKLKWQLQLRTRIKRFFYKLARSL